MDDLKNNLQLYEQRLSQVESALLTTTNKTEKQELLSLQNDLKELVALTKESIGNEAVPSGSSTSNGDTIDDEYALFMSEIAKDNCTESTSTTENTDDIHKELKSLEGMKCRAPFTHEWGDIVYHNAMVCAVMYPESLNYDDIEVKVMFINPTHQNMLPCPYYLDTECKFSDDKCRFSHGESVLFSSLQEYVEPDFSSLSVGSKVLAKQGNNLWHRGTIRRMYTDKCLIKFDTNSKDVEVDLHDTIPLDGSILSSDESSSSDSETELNDREDVEREDVINMSLMTTPSKSALGDWEKHTKGIGSKLMEKMGYIVGSGLGRNSDGILEPVTAVILPAGKSLDHCMNLREQAGGDKDLFSAEKKLKRLQKKQEMRSKRAYEREQNKTDVFNFLNKKLQTAAPESLQTTRSKHRLDIKKETCRELNVANLKLDEDMKRCERDLWKIKESLSRHTDPKTQINKNLKEQLKMKENELLTLQTKATNVRNEQNIRSNKKKLTIF